MDAAGNVSVDYGREARNVLSGETSVIVWASISNTGPNLVRHVSGMMNAAAYCDILQNLSLSPAITKTRGFIHDFHTVYRSPLVNSWFEQQSVLRPLPWCRDRPDLMPLHHAFQQVARLLNTQYPKMKTKEDLLRGIFDAWDKHINEEWNVWSLVYGVNKKIEEESATMHNL